MVVLGVVAGRPIHQPVVAGPQPVPVGLQGTEQVDAPDHAAVPPGPVPADQPHVSGMRLVQHGVVEDKDAGGGQQRLHLVPQSVGVGFQPVQQAREGIVGGGVGSVRLAAGGLGGGGLPLGSDQEGEVVVGPGTGRFIALRCTRSGRSYHPQTTNCVSPKFVKRKRLSSGLLGTRSALRTFSLRLVRWAR